MTVSAPGQECLTKTQTMHREMLEQIKSRAAQPAPGLDAAAEDTAKAADVKPDQSINAGNETNGSGSYGSRYSKNLDITV